MFSSGAAKKGKPQGASSGARPSASGSGGGNPLKGSSIKMPSDITIIPKPGGSAAAAAAKRPPMMKAAASSAAADPDVIDLDDDVEEIDDVEDASVKVRNSLLLALFRMYFNCLVNQDLL